MTTSKLTKASEIQDLATNQFYEKYRFTKTDGRSASIVVRRSEAADINAFKAKLLDSGCNLPPDRAEANKQIKSAVDSITKRRKVFASTTGWASSTAYVLKKRMIGSSKLNIVGTRPTEHGSLDGSLTYKGTSSSWSSSVGRLASNSSLLMTTISAAFSAPLLHLLGVPSFSVCLSGPTRNGKTVSIATASSVIGIAEERQLISWNLTTDHLEERLPEFNDCLFPIDDMQAIRGGLRDRYGRVRDITYGLSTGKSKGRSRNYETPLNRKSWRTILLTSSEKTLQELADAANCMRDDGEIVRMINIPVNHLSGDDLLDLAPADINREAFFRDLRQACLDSHGAVFKRYLRKLVRHSERYAVDAALYMLNFEDSVSTATDSRIARDLAKKFGVIFAGGRLAISLNLVPWSADALLTAIQKTYQSCVGLLPNPAQVLKDGKLRAKRFLEQLPRRRAVGSFDSVDGYRFKRAREQICIIRCHAFKSCFETTHEHDLVMNWLVENGRITMASSKKRTIKEQFSWPDGTRARSYEIILAKND